MRKTKFGDLIIESTEDNLGEAFPEDDGAYAMIMVGDDGCYFELMANTDGEECASSDEIFETVDDAKKYLSGWLSPDDIQVIG